MIKYKFKIIATLMIFIIAAISIFYNIGIQFSGMYEDTFLKHLQHRQYRVPPQSHNPAHYLTEYAMNALQSIKVLGCIPHITIKDPIIHDLTREFFYDQSFCGQASLRRYSRFYLNKGLGYNHHPNELYCELMSFIKEFKKDISTDYLQKNSSCIYFKRPDRQIDFSKSEFKNIEEECDVVDQSFFIGEHQAQILSHLSKYDKVIAVHGAELIYPMLLGKNVISFKNKKSKLVFFERLNHKLSKCNLYKNATFHELTAKLGPKNYLSRFFGCDQDGLNRFHKCYDLIYDGSIPD